MGNLGFLEKGDLRKGGGGRVWPPLPTINLEHGQAFLLIISSHIQQKSTSHFYSFLWYFWLINCQDFGYPWACFTKSIWNIWIILWFHGYPTTFKKYFSYLFSLLKYISHTDHFEVLWVCLSLHDQNYLKYNNWTLKNRYWTLKNTSLISHKYVRHKQKLC